MRSIRMLFNFKDVSLPEFGSPFQLIKAAQKMCVDSSSMKILPEDFQKLAVTEFRGWIYEGKDMPSKSNIRRLSWSLNFGDDPIINNIDELNYTLKLFLPKKITKKMIMGLIFSYFYCCNKDERILEILQTRIRLVLKYYEKKQTSLTHWQDNAYTIFSRDSIVNIAKTVIQSAEIAGALEYFKIPTDSYYYQRCLTKIADKFVENNEFYKQINELILLLEKDATISTLQTCIDSLLHGLIVLGKKEIQHELCSFALKHFGDPRISRSVRWNVITQESKNLVIQWVSTSDITLFFDAVAMDVRRKNFWLKYVEFIEYSKLVFGSKTLQSSDPAICKFIEEKRHAKLCECLNSDCAFIIKIGNIVVVEFNQTGNACYIYYANTIPFSLDEITYAKPKIRNQGYAVKRLFHQNAWEATFQSYFSSQFGIKHL